MKTNTSWRMRILTGAALLNAATLAACGQTYYPSYNPNYVAPAPYAPVGYSDAPVQYAPVPPAPPVLAVEAAPRLSDAQIDQLTAPIALYPDPLLAQVLPAATYPQDLVDAQAWLQATPNPDELTIDSLPWDPSVKALVHYPTVLAMMSQNIPWTQALGAAFINQQADVMASIQRLRLAALNADVLATTPQQQVVWNGSTIQVLPPTPDVIYVPVYEPQIVYASIYQPGIVIEEPPRIWFTPGIRVGRWLDADVDWDDHFIVVGDGWHHGWRHDEQRGWEHDDRADRNWHSAVRQAPPQHEAPRGAPREAPRPFTDNTVHVGQTWRHDPARPAPVMPAPIVAAARQTTVNDHRGWTGQAPAAQPKLPIQVPHPAPPAGAIPHTPAPRGPAAPLGPRGPAAPNTPPRPTPVPPATPPVAPHPPGPIPTPPAPHPTASPAPHPAAPPATPAVNVFGGYQNRTDIQRAQERAQQSRPTPNVAPPTPPAPHPAAPTPPAPTPPAPHPLAPPAPPAPPAPHPAAAPAPAPVIHQPAPEPPAPRPVAPPPAPTLRPPTPEPPGPRPVMPPAPAFHPPTPAPAPAPHPTAPPSPAPAAGHPAPAAPAFQGIDSADDTKAQSDRGHGSMQHH